MELLDNALETLRLGLLGVSNGEYESNSENQQGWREGKLETNEASVQLRLDWELNNDVVDTADADTVSKLMFEHLRFDFEDLLENGDTSHTSDPLIKAMDGSKKRGQKPVEIEFLSARLFKERKDRKGTTEFTLYVRPYVRWE